MVCMGYILYTLKTDKNVLIAFPENIHFHNCCRLQTKRAIYRSFKINFAKNTPVCDWGSDRVPGLEWGWVAWRMCLVSGHYIAAPGTRMIRADQCQEAVDNAGHRSGVSHYWHYLDSLAMVSLQTSESDSRKLWSSQEQRDKAEILFQVCMYSTISFSDAIKISV